MPQRMVHRLAAAGRSALAVAAVALELFGAAGCKRKPPPEETVDGWALARKALTSGRECFAARPEYCITDPAFVDAAIQPRLDELYGGEMPLRKVNADAIVRASITEYRRAMMKPENMLRVEELVRERYGNPKITMEGDEVVVDMGVVPGPIGPSLATSSLRLVSSELIENGSWKESEAHRVLSSFAKKYPEKRRVRVGVTIVSARGGMEPETYRYLRDDKRVAVYLGDDAHTTKPLADEGELATVPLSLAALEPCKIELDAGPAGEAAPGDRAHLCPALPEPPSDD